MQLNSFDTLRKVSALECLVSINAIGAFCMMLSVLGCAVRFFDVAQITQLRAFFDTIWQRGTKYNDLF